MMQGTFNVHAGAIEIVEAPSWTRDLVHRMTPAQARRVSAGVAWAKAKIEAEPENEAEVRAKLLKLFEKDAPWLSSFIEAATSSRIANFATIVTFIVLLLTMLGVDLSGEISPPRDVVVITDDQLEEMFKDYLERREGDQRPSLPKPEPERPEQAPPPTTKM